MKLKNLLKKSISTLLCVSTLSFSAGMLNTHALSTVCNLNLIDNVLSLTNCTTWSSEALANYQFIPHAICKEDGLCNYFNEANQLIGNNSPTQQASSGSIFSIFLNPFVLSALIGLVGNLASYAVKAYDSYCDKHAQQKNEEQMKKDGLTDPVKTIDRLDHNLIGIEGQDEALDEVRKFVLNLVDERNQKLQGTSKKEGINNVMYFWGPSGTGKSLTAESLVKALNGPNAEPFILEPSQLSDSKIFGVVPVKVLKGEVNQPTPVVKQLIQNPYTVFIFNEVDKYDKKGEKKYLKEIEETLRTIIDHGYIYINGEKIDCSKAVFILTSNADLRSIKDESPAKDPTGSLNQVDHDKSFLNRIKVVEFKNLNVEAYKKIAKPKFEALQKRYLDEYDVYVTFEDNLLEEVAKLVELKNQGARPIQDFINAINSKLLNEVILQGAKDKSYIGKVVEFSLENKENNPEFKLSDSKKHKKALLLLSIDPLKNFYLSEHNLKINISDQTFNELSSFMEEHNLTVQSIVKLLVDKIDNDIISSENSKMSFWQKHFSSKAPSYSGKTYDIQFNNYQLGITEFDPSKATKSIETTLSQDSEDKEIAPELSEIDKQKAEFKTLEDSKADITPEKESVVNPVETATAA